MSGDTKNKKDQLIDQKISSDRQVSHVPTSNQNISEYHDDYDQIKSAVLETKRGRWFLGEYARKSKQVESQLVLDALAAIEVKIDAKQPSIAQPSKIKAEPELATQKPNFETQQQSSYFGQLFANFKHNTASALSWAGVKGAIEFSKIQTIINFAAFQSRASIQSQEKKLNAIIGELQTQNIDSKIINKLNGISTELHKLEQLQGNLNIQLEDGLKFMGEVEKIAQNLPPNLEKIATKTPKTELNTPKNVQKTPKIEPKIAKNAQKTPIIEPKTTQIEPEKPKIGPAGRIKKMFKIEQTLHQQIAENIAEPGKAFDEAFAQQQLAVETLDAPVSTAKIIETDLAPIDATKHIQASNKISQQSEKLATLGDMMKQVEQRKTSAAATETENSEPEIIVEDGFNALNSLALLSKTERTMLFTLQH